MLPFFLIGLLSYLVEIKMRTSRRVVCKRDNSHFLRYVLTSLDIRVLPFGNLFSKLYVTFILQWIDFIFGRDKEEDQSACSVKRHNSQFLFYVRISP